MGKSLEEHRLEKTIWLLGSRETKDPYELESKKKSTLVQDRYVRTIKERDMNTDRWKIETPPGIGNEEERSQKEVTHGKQECNEDKLETRVMRLEEQKKMDVR